MFVPVACSECGKPFQVPDAAVGKPTVCPWCQTTVAALPLGTPIALPAPDPEPTPASPPATESRDSPRPARRDDRDPAPLPLDDAPPSPPAPPFNWFPWWVIVATVLGLVLATGVTIGVLRYKKGHVLNSEWRLFSPPDSPCAIELLGRPYE